MNFFSQIFSNKVLGISMFACFLAQFIKIFTGKEKRIDFYCRDPDSGGGSLAWFSDCGETFP